MAVSPRAPASAERLPAPAATALGGWSGPPALLALALAAACAYAAFASGATGVPGESRLQLGLVVVALAAVAGWAGRGGGLRWRAGPAAAVGLGLLVALAVWSAVSLLWTLTPDRTWLEVNRVLAYALVVALAVAVGASDPRAVERTALLLLASAVLVAGYALGDELLRGWGDGDAGRLGSPLGSPGALGLLSAMAAPIAVVVAADPGRGRWGRALGLVAALVLVAVLVLTWSRGALVALAVAVIVLAALDRGSRVARVLAAVAAAAILAGTVGAVASGGGLSARLDSFRAPAGEELDGPERLRSASSDNRWAWWNEAGGAWSDRPVAGWGAGSFPATHLRYREDELAVAQAHSVPLQLLAETGLVGLVLFAGAMGALVAAAVVRLRTRTQRRERALAAAGLAAVAAWAAHGLWDPDWSVPAVTLPVLVLLGVLAAVPGRERRPEAGSAPALAAALAALALSAVAASALLPAWADGKAADARRADRPRAGEPALAEAAAQAELAARLDPLAVRPLFVAAAIERRRGRLLESRSHLLEAVDRQPASAEAWRQLARAAAGLADRAGFERAALRALELDPRSPRTRRLALEAVAFRAPPGASATAVGTPLTPAPVPATAIPPVVPLPPTGATGPTGPTGP